MKIALIDDDEDVRFVLALGLRDNHDIVELKGGREALEYDGWDYIDVAIIDVMMPSVSGSDVVAWLANEHPRVRRVICSAKGSYSLDYKLFNLAHDVVDKPFTKESIESAING